MEFTVQFPLYATALGGGILILQNVLMLSVGMYRAGAKKGVGNDDDTTLERLVRRHGNLAENAGIFVVALALYELLVGQTTFAMWIAITFGVARVLHAVGFSHLAGSHLIEAKGGRAMFLAMRSLGAMATALSGMILGALIIYTLLSHGF